jgi:uncharacterized protein YdhG (YjbR/CyaY superfamily)
MKTQSTHSNAIDIYIAGFPEETQRLLEELRITILEAAPGAEQVISYQMPAFKLNRVLVYFAAYNNHIGFYPTASGIEVFKSEFSEYKWSKGAVQFPLDKPLPLDLISKIVKFRVEEDRMKSRKK